jgi:peroxiredoxin
VAELRPHIPELEAAGGRVVIIGSGWPAAARDFVAQAQLPAQVLLLSDGELRSFKLAGLKRSIFRTLSPLGWPAAIRAYRKGHRQSSPKGDVWQLGGALVIGTGGTVAYSKANSSPSDHPRPAALLAALQSLGSAQAA